MYLDYFWKKHEFENKIYESQFAVFFLQMLEVCWTTVVVDHLIAALLPRSKKALVSDLPIRLGTFCVESAC